MTREAFIVVDVQNDFCEGGALAVEGGNLVAENIAKFLPTIPVTVPVAFTMDWHQKDSDNGGHIALPPAEPDFVDSWPIHCIANTKGAALHSTLRAWTSAKSPVFKKGYNCPSYSGFDASAKDSALGSGMHDWLTQEGVTTLNVMGLASDYCVKATALDGILHGYNVRILADLTRGIAQPIEDTVREVNEAMARQAVTVG